jgi:hypothetical protein
MGKCKKCERKWTSLTECHCSGCCNHFKSEAAFRKHRSIKEGRCFTVDEMLEMGMAINDRGNWVSAPHYKFPASITHKAKTRPKMVNTGTDKG